MAALYSYVPIINTTTSVALTTQNHKAFVIVTGLVDDVVVLPPQAEVPLGFSVTIFNASANPAATLAVSTWLSEPNINFRTSNGTAVNGSTFDVQQFGAVTISRGGTVGSALSTPWQAAGDIV
jgi:hypothetical protein